MMIAKPSILKTFITFLFITQNCLAHENTQTWSHQRQNKNLEIQNYYQNNKEGFEALVNESNGRGQIPAILFRVFPQLFSDIWGGEDQKFVPAGLNPNPYPNASPNVPFGMAISKIKYEFGTASGVSKLKTVGFNCVACHAGQVRVGKKIEYLIGAPSNRVDNLFFMMARTTQHPNFNIGAFREALKTIPEIEFAKAEYGYSKEDLELFLNTTSGDGEKIISDIKNQGSKLLWLFDKYVRPRVYSHENSPDALAKKRGPHDAFIATVFAYLGQLLTMQLPLDQLEKALEEGVPKSAAEVDSPSVWNQNAKGPNSHWDGTLTGLLHRNIGAASATHNKPVDIDNIMPLTQFIGDLPSNPYPFKVNMKLAKRGEQHFKNYCASCHQGQTKVIDYLHVGTDPERAIHLSTPTRKFLGSLLNLLCPTTDQRCLKPDGSAFKPEELVAPQAVGFISDQLDGVWARAPYLHNGSVPTLYHLLVPESRNREAQTFYRGSFLYDTKKVGYRWWDDKGDITNSDIFVDTVIYDTRLVGNSNRGHDTAEYLGNVNWGARDNRRKLSELLEYLKTL